MVTAITTLIRCLRRWQLRYKQQQLQPDTNGQRLNMHSLHSLFFPESVALIGASSDPERIGGRVLRFMLEGGYQGTIYPINKGEP
ncbi:MAG: CoA-binding protein, partial [Pseudomonadota bacterium]